MTPTLNHWSVYPGAKRECQELFVGDTIYGWIGEKEKITSPITKIDTVNSTVETQSGKTYQLGVPGRQLKTPPPDSFCCSFMQSQLTYSCKQHDPYVCPDVVVTYNANSKYTNGYSLVAPNAHYRMRYCPACGKDLGEHKCDT